MVPTPIADRSECADVRRRPASGPTGSLSPQSRRSEPTAIPQSKAQGLQGRTRQLNSVCRAWALRSPRSSRDRARRHMPSLAGSAGYLPLSPRGLRFCRDRNKNTVKGGRSRHKPPRKARAVDASPISGEISGRQPRAARVSPSSTCSERVNRDIGGPSKGTP